MDLGRAFKESWETFKKFPMPVIIGYMVLSFVNSLASSLITGNFLAGWSVIADKAFRGEEPKVDDGFRGFDNFLDKFVAGLVMMSGTLLCGVGAVVTGALFLFAPVIIQRKGVDWKTACSESKELVMGNLGQVALLLLAISGINTLGVLACCVGVIVTAPLGMLMLHHAYLQLTGEI